MQTQETVSLSNEEMEVVGRIYEKYSAANSLMILLQQIQSEFGYVPEFAIRYLSKRMHGAESHIYGVLTFYSQFSLKPVGKNIIKFCHGTACYVGGSKALGKKLKSYLKIDEDSENTEDMLFTVQSVACLGCCALAPSMMVNDKAFGKLDIDRIKEIIEKYRKASIEEDI